MANSEGVWLSIIEYSQYKKVSISTIRRHIKASLVKWREEDGKYFIWTAASQAAVAQKEEAEILALKLENQRLIKFNRELQVELEEARMLIALYEQGCASSHDSPPEVPLA